MNFKLFNCIHLKWVVFIVQNVTNADVHQLIIKDNILQIHVICIFFPETYAQTAVKNLVVIPATVIINGRISIGNINN